jgi:hypothetical protein
MPDPRALRAAILDLHAGVRDEIVGATERQSIESLSSVDRDEPDDTIYAIDVIAERVVARFAAFADSLIFYACIFE